MSLKLVKKIMIIKKIGQFFLDIIETLVIALSIFLVVYLFFMQPHQVNGQSMVPNFQSGEYVLTDKISYRFRNPERGEVVVFHAPEAAHCPKGTGCDFIKRVIAVPGETVEIKNNQIYINGKILPEEYIPDDFETRPGEYTRGRVITIRSDEYFLIGDNRPYSSDGRVWGPVPKDQIVGKAFFRYWPFNVAGKLETANYGVGF